MADTFRNGLTLNQWAFEQLNGLAAVGSSTRIAEADEARRDALWTKWEANVAPLIDQITDSLTAMQTVDLA